MNPPEPISGDKLIRQRVAVVVLNWNGWCDTIACLDSLLPTLPADAVVVLCDNASSDGSVAHIQAWLTGHGSVPAGQPSFVTSHARRPAAWVLYDRQQAEAGGSDRDPQLVMVQTGANLGFAGGNNVGIRYALARGFSHVWLLNNDTVVNEYSLTALLQRMLTDPSIGMCGSTLIYFHHPEQIQALGGSSFDPRTGIGQHLGLGCPTSQLPEPSVIEARMDYVVGASMMVSREFLLQVGLMCEDYFLYFEEMDWAMRATGRFRLGWAPDSLVWHKEGGSIGSDHRLRPSATSLRYIYRNRLRFAARHTPQYFWSVWRRMAFEALVYLKRKDFAAVFIILRVLLRRQEGQK